MFPNLTTLTIHEHTPISYHCVESVISVEELGIVHTYGIELRISCANKSMNLAQTILLYPDVSMDREKMYRLVDLMNELQLSPNHLEDVIEDFLLDTSVE